MKPLTTNQQLFIGAVITVIILFAALLYEHHTLQGAIDVIQEQERTIELLKNQKTETIIKRDTIYQEKVVYTKPPQQPKEKIVYDTVYIPSDQPLFLVTKTFQDELLQGNLTINYQADVMGYQRKGEENLPTITSMAVKVRYPETHQETETTTTQTIVQPQRKRLKPIILPTIGVGYDPIHNTIAPTVGISIGLAKGT